MGLVHYMSRIQILDTARFPWSPRCVYIVYLGFQEEMDKGLYLIHQQFTGINIIHILYYYVYIVYINYQELWDNFRTISPLKGILGYEPDISRGFGKVWDS